MQEAGSFLWRDAGTVFIIMYGKWDGRLPFTQVFYFLNTDKAPLNSPIMSKEAIELPVGEFEKRCT